MGKELEQSSGDYWNWFFAFEGLDYEIKGKYLFFSSDREKLVGIATEEICEGLFHVAKIPLPGKEKNSEYVLCLYYKDDSKKHELADKYKARENLKYRYWKSNEATGKNQYSGEFLKGLSLEDRKKFENKKSLVNGESSSANT